MNDNRSALNDVVERARAARERTGHWPGSHAEALCNECERLQRALDQRNEQIDGYERQLGIDNAGAERTIGSEIERLRSLQGECPSGTTSDPGLRQAGTPGESPAPLSSKNRSLQVALGLLGDAMNHGPSEPVFALIAEARDTIESALRDETTARQTKTSAWHAALLAEIEAQKALIERMDNPRNHEMRDNGIMTVLRAERLDLLEKLREFEPAFSEKSGEKP